MVRQKSRPEVFFSSFSRPYLLDAFYVEFGSLWAPFWRPLAHFGVPLAHFWLTFGALWFTFAHLGVHFLTLAVSWPLFLYFSVFSSKISCKIIFLNNSHRKSILNQSNRIFPKSAERTPTESISSLVTHPQGPGAEHLPLAT